MNPSSNSLQRGAAMIVSLIMLVLVTLLVITALNLGSSNFKAVSNSQFRDEAIAAANAAIQTRIGLPFNANGVAVEIPIDVNRDGASQTVVVTPRCISASIADAVDPSSLSLPPEMSAAATWNTVWDIEAVVTDAATGASVTINAGVRVLLSQVERDAACPDV